MKQENIKFQPSWHWHTSSLESLPRIYVKYHQHATAKKNPMQFRTSILISPCLKIALFEFKIFFSWLASIKNVVRSLCYFFLLVKMSVKFFYWLVMALDNLVFRASLNRIQGMTAAKSERVVVDSFEFEVVLKKKRTFLPKLNYIGPHMH